MAVNQKGEKWLFDAPNSVKGDGLSLPPDDTYYLEALIDEYFNESGSDCDDECGSKFGYVVRLLLAFFQ